MTRADGPELRAERYTFTYGSADAPQLRDLTFAVGKGERVAVMGATGAGKTTLAMSMNGLIPHHHEGTTTGLLEVAGQDTSAATIADLVRHVGLVMQDPESQITGRYARDDAAVGPANLGLPRAEVLARALAALVEVGLGDLADRDTAQMSGGQQQRLAIAGILAMRPEVLVLDEPTSELDPAGTEQVFAVVREVSAQTGRTVVLVEHEPELVAAWADRLLVLTNGALVFDGPPADFFAQADLVAAAGLRPPGVTEAVATLRAAGLTPVPDGGARLPVTVAEALAELGPFRRGARVTEPQTDATDAPDAACTGGPVMVQAVDLDHRYPSGVQALTGVDLQVRRGDFVALLGRNGAGKTTFARHLNGLLRPTTGSVHIKGEPTASRKLHEIATEVGYVFQNPDHQIFAASVREEIGFGLKNLGRDADRIEERVQQVLDQVGMPGLADVHPYRLGKGQRQRLAVASVLALEPEILVIDEPTTGQDWTGSVAMMDLVADLNASGHTILMITHDMLLAARYARRAVVFDGGRVRADRPIHELFADPDLLRDAHLRPPQVTELALALGLPPVTSADEFAAVWGGARVS
ncbi:ABC transporter ATP-binding protein [Occultella kanbiaonis]|uniref:ABC transporter ATP-binding protein n=1 Tax=Occultella kanbiaonis TaxID=2675754 RepID=UPI0013CF4450|nr:ABC transporter ATP-binding protein [Occultella kanbiaonis]